MPLTLVKSNRAFEIWEVDFVGPFPQIEKKTDTKYIIMAIEYVTKLEEDELVESCTK
jgi:hypothetical protein